MQTSNTTSHSSIFFDVLCKHRTSCLTPKTQLTSHVLNKQTMIMKWDKALISIFTSQNYDHKYALAFSLAAKIYPNIYKNRNLVICLLNLKNKLSKDEDYAFFSQPWSTLNIWGLQKTMTQWIVSQTKWYVNRCLLF